MPHIVPASRNKNTNPSISFLLCDEFTTTAVAPLTSPRTCEPGPGTLTIVDTTNKASISAGSLVLAGGAGSHGDPGVWGGARTRAMGLALIGEFTKTAGGTTEVRFGWDTDQSGAAQQAGLYLNLLVIKAEEGGLANLGTLFDNIVLSTSYKYAAVLRTTGMYLFIKGGVYTEWTLIWIGTLGSTATVYPAITNATLPASITAGFFRVCQLGSPFNVDYAFATNRVASPSVGEIITSEANAFIEETWVAVTGQTWNFYTRRTDDSNCWIHRIDQGGSTIKLIEVVAGVETERASAAQTFTNGVSYRLSVIQDGNNIMNNVDRVRKNSYASASFNNTATGVKTDRAGTNLIAWPRTLSGAAATQLNDYST